MSQPGRRSKPHARPSVQEHNRGLSTATAVVLLLLLAAMSPVGGHATIAHGQTQRAPLGAHVVAAPAGSLVLRGALSSETTMTMSGAFSVGHARDLSWDLPRLVNMRTSGYTEAVRSETYRFNIAPDSSQDLQIGGQSIRRFHWTEPPANSVITVSVGVQLTLSSRLEHASFSAPYPLHSVPAEIAPFLAVTSSLRLPSSTDSVLRTLTSGTTKEEVVVRQIANWVASHTQYDPSLANGPYDATWVIKNHRATCQGFSSLMAGMLRRLGIPSQVVYGWVSSAPIRIPGNGPAGNIQWATPGTAGTLHDWLNVYFPGTGWVAFDPQMEKFFVDPRHVAFLTQPDASVPTLGSWSATQIGNQPVVGHALRGGMTEIVPGDGWGRTSMHSVDTFRFRVHSLVRDVQGVRLFTR